MTKRAVVVEINDYSDSSERSTLSSCVPDADSMMDLFVSAFGFDSGTDITGGLRRRHVSAKMNGKE